MVLGQRRNQKNMQIRDKDFIFTSSCDDEMIYLSQDLIRSPSSRGLPADRF